MALSYGFYNSLDGDRLYDAEEFSSFLDGIVYDGVYQAVGNKFYVEAYDGMKVTVDTGRAWFNHTWTLNNSKLIVDIPAADSVYDRIDAVVIEINKNDRKNYIKVVKGNPSSTPQRPLLIKSNALSQYALAYIRVPVNASSISQGNITYVVDTSETPLCSALALAGIPSGGTIGQVLAKRSSESGVVGWYDIDKLPFEKWYLADGITENNVLGAYKLSRTLDENTALTPVNQNKSYQLAKVNNPVWNNTNGYTIVPGKGLNNVSLWNTSPSSVVMYLNGVDYGQKRDLSALTVTGGANGSYTRALFLSLPYGAGSGSWLGMQLIGTYMRTDQERNRNEWLKPGNMACPVSAVVGVTWHSNSTRTIYVNGVAIGEAALPSNIDSSVAASTHSEASMIVGSTDVSLHYTVYSAEEYGSFNVSHAAYYSTQLTAAQHYEIARYMIADRAS